MSSPTPVPTSRDHERGAAHRADLEDRAGIVVLSVGVTALAVAVLVRTDALGVSIWLRVVAGLAIGLIVSALTLRLLRPWRRLAPRPTEEEPPEAAPYAELQDRVRPQGLDGHPLPEPARAEDHADPQPEPGPDPEPALPPDPGRWRDLDVDPTDRRALLLLVRSLEATLEEQHAAITALQSLSPPPSGAGQDSGPAPDLLPYAASDAGAETELGPRRTQLVMEALSHLEGPAASARVDAAIGRLGAPALFVRPPLAAFLPRPEVAHEPPVAEDRAEVAAPSSTAVPGPEPVPMPVPEVVLPVPASTKVVPAPRRRLFRSSAA